MCYREGDSVRGSITGHQQHEDSGTLINTDKLEMNSSFSDTLPRVTWLEKQ